MADRFGLPVFTFIDTPGAYPGVGAEERGQAEAIGAAIAAMARVTVPIISVIIGEGGSGGALALGVADRINMLENADYSVITVEGCAAILWKDGERTPDAAESLRLTAPDLLRHGLIDGIVPEPPGGAHRLPAEAAATLKATILRELDALSRVPLAKLLADRREKYRRAGALPGRFPRVD